MTVMCDKSKLFCMVLLLLVGLFTFSCKKDNPEENDSPENVEMVLGKNTFKLTDEQQNYVLETDDNFLSFDSSCPVGKLPEVGQIVLVDSPTEKFPYGYLGRVTSISKIEGCYCVETETVPLDVAFERLYINQTFDLYASNDMSSTRGIYVDDEGFGHLKEDWKVHFGGGEVYGGVDLGLRAQLCIDIDNVAKKPYAHIIVGTKIAGNMGLKINTSGEIGDEGNNPYKVPIGPAFLLNTTVSNVAVKPVLQFYVSVKAEGEVALESGVDFNKQFTSALVYKDEIWEGGTKEVPCEEYGEKKLPQTRFTLNGSVFAGIIAALELRVFGSNELKASLDFSTGVYEEGDISLSLGEDNIFNTLKDTKMQAGVGVQVDAIVKAKIFNTASTFKKNILEPILFFKDTRYVFPEFENFDIQTSPEEKMAIVRCKVERNLLWGSKIGFVVYQGDIKVQQSAGVYYFNNENFNSPLTADFGNLQDGVEYTVRSYIDCMGIHIESSDMCYFTLADGEIGGGNEDDFSIVGTWEYYTLPDNSNNRLGPIIIKNSRAFITFEDNGEFSYTIYGDQIVSGYGRWRYDESFNDKYNIELSYDYSGLGSWSTGFGVDRNKEFTVDYFSDTDGANYNRIGKTSVLHSLKTYKVTGGFYVLGLWGDMLYSEFY